MIKKLHILSSILLCTLFFTSCKKEIVADDIYAYWKLQNDVEFKELAFTNLEFTNDEKWGSWVDPVINDSIYHYKSLTVKGDSLCLVDDNNKELILTIEELHDSTLVISNFPGANKSLEFKRIADVIRDDLKQPFKYGMSPSFDGIEAKNYSSDSLDINLKSTLSQEEANWYGKSVILSQEQVQQAHKLLEECMNSKEYVNLNNGCADAYPFNEYFRQYSGVIIDGEIYAKVVLTTSMLGMFSPPYTNLKRQLLVTNDGGPSHAQASVNLTKNKVVGFLTNGPHDPQKYRQK